MKYFTIYKFRAKNLKNRRKMGHPQFNRKEIVDKILERTKDSSKLIKLSELASLTDIQLYQLYLNN